MNKARGKSGPLFSFDVHEDVRLIGDASVEKDEVGRLSYSGKLWQALNLANWLSVVISEVLIWRSEFLAP